MTEADHILVRLVETGPAHEVFQTSVRTFGRIRNAGELAKPRPPAAPSFRVEVGVVDTVFAASDGNDQNR